MNLEQFHLLFCTAWSIRYEAWFIAHFAYFFKNILSLLFLGSLRLLFLETQLIHVVVVFSLIPVMVICREDLELAEMVLGDYLPKTADFLHYVKGRDVWMGNYHDWPSLYFGLLAAYTYLSDKKHIWCQGLLWSLDIVVFLKSDKIRLGGYLLLVHLSLKFAHLLTKLSEIYKNIEYTNLLPTSSSKSLQPLLILVPQSSPLRSHQFECVSNLKLGMLSLNVLPSLINRISQLLWVFLVTYNLWE